MAYITIKDFAQRAGVSTQAVYQRLDKDLQSYFKLVDKRKMIEESALELFAPPQVVKQIDKEIDNDLSSTLQETIKLLSSQLSEKDEQIREKDRQIQRKDEQIEKLNERLAEAFELNKNNQVLIARGQEPKRLEAQTVEVVNQEGESQEIKTAPEEEKQERKSFFDIFRRRKQ